MIVVAAGGLVAGMLHVLSGPDHLAAVAPLVADGRGRRWLTGFLWGLGHTSGVLAVGVLALLLRGVLPIDHISAWSERIVGIALIGVGLWGLVRAARTRLHVHAHAHDGSTHTHVHVHSARAPAPDVGHERTAHTHTHASFAFGVLHGLAGSSHVLGILPALALPSQAASVTYLASYGVGTIGAMTLFSAAVGIVTMRARRGGPWAYRMLLTTCSVAAIAVGTVWVTTS
jgi:ABC-type nickel/cobalt efflux system permease component RcnA